MDTKQFQQQILPLTDRIFPLARRLLGNACDAEDLVQEVLLKLWDNRDKLDHHENPIGYILFTTRNACLDKLKKKKPKRMSVNMSYHTSQNIAKVYEDNEAVAIIQRIMVDLSEQQRTVIELRDFDGFELVEIAESMQLEVSYVRVLLSRARKIIREKMIKIYDYERRKI